MSRNKELLLKIIVAETIDFGKKKAYNIQHIRNIFEDNAKICKK